MTITAEPPQMAAESADGAPLVPADPTALFVSSARGLLAAAAAGEVPDGVGESLVASLVGMIATVEASINALAARRSALLAVAATVVDSLPGTMVPVLPDAPVTARDRDHARRALVADVATATGASELTTATLVDTATALTRDLPGVLTSMAGGLLGDKQARQIVRHAEGLPVAAMSRYETDLLSRIRDVRTPSRVGALARAARERVHPTTLTERHERASAERTVLVDPAPDGMAWLSAFLPAVQAHAIYDKLDGIAHALQQDEAEQRTLPQLRVDALTGLALDPPAWEVGTAAPSSRSASPSRSAPSSQAASSPESATPPFDPEAPWCLDPALRSLRPTVAVTVPAMTLLGLSEEPGHLDGYGPIDPHTARLLAAHAPSFIRLLTHPETGTVLSVGRERYRVPADLRTWLRLRDQTCRFPGCAQPATRADVDHTVPFCEDGARGSTSAGNLAHLCPKHHRLKHTSRWRVVHHPDARLTWTSPTGRTHTSEPGLEVAARAAARRGPSGGPSAGEHPGTGPPGDPP